MSINELINQLLRYRSSSGSNKRARETTAAQIVYSFTFQTNPKLPSIGEVLTCTTDETTLYTSMRKSFRALSGRTKNLAELAQNSIDAVAEDNNLLTIGGHSEGAKIAIISLLNDPNVDQVYITSTPVEDGDARMWIEELHSGIAFCNRSKGTFTLQSVYLGTTSKRDRTPIVDVDKQGAIIDKVDVIAQPDVFVLPAPSGGMFVTRTVVTFKKMYETLRNETRLAFIKSAFRPSTETQPVEIYRKKAESVVNLHFEMGGDRFVCHVYQKNVLCNTAENS